MDSVLLLGGVTLPPEVREETQLPKYDTQTPNYDTTDFDKVSF